MTTPSQDEPPVLTRPDEVEAAVGKLVTLRGKVENRKIATLLGVDVDSDSPNLRGQEATATGVVRKQTVTQAELDEKIAREGQFANRGAGVFYHLIDATTHRLAKVRRP